MSDLRGHGPEQKRLRSHTIVTSGDAYAPVRCGMCFISSLAQASLCNHFYTVSQDKDKDDEVTDDEFIDKSHAKFEALPSTL